VGLIQIYIDKDAVNRALVLALRSRDVSVLTALEAALIEVEDERHLAFATERGCVLYTYNVSDFYRLHTEWINAGRAHAGMILVPQQRYSVGEQLRRVLRLRATVSSESM
jgi:hypothetical protein